jgi:hypothetical protein
MTLIEFFIDAPSRFVFGLSPGEMLKLWGLTWTKYAKGWRASDTFIEEVKTLNDLWERWHASRLERLLSWRPKRRAYVPSASVSSSGFDAA